jgi:hypothetical protein
VLLIDHPHNMNVVLTVPKWQFYVMPFLAHGSLSLMPSLAEHAGAMAFLWIFDGIIMNLLLSTNHDSLILTACMLSCHLLLTAAATLLEQRRRS